MLCCYCQYSILLLPGYGIVRRAPYTVRQTADIADSLKGNLVAHLVGRSRAGWLHEFGPFVLGGRRDALLQRANRRPQCVDLPGIVVVCRRAFAGRLRKLLPLVVGQLALDVVLVDSGQQRLQVVFPALNDLFKEFFQKITSVRRAPMCRLNCNKEPPAPTRRSADTRPCTAAMCRRPGTRSPRRYRLLKLCSW